MDKSTRRSRDTHLTPLNEILVTVLGAIPRRPSVAVPQPPVMADALRDLRGDDGWWAAVVNDTPPVDE